MFSQSFNITLPHEYEHQFQLEELVLGDAPPLMVNTPWLVLPSEPAPSQCYGHVAALYIYRGVRCATSQSLAASCVFRRFGVALNCIRQVHPQTCLKTLNGEMRPVLHKRPSCYGNAVSRRLDESWLGMVGVS
jgi:hypothetical protein